MFDLFRSRDKSVRIMLGAMLVVVSLSMLTYLVPNYDMGSDADAMVVAQVGKEKIMVQDVQKTLQMVLKSRQLPPEILPHYIPQMIESMVTERALAYEAGRLGYQISDSDLAIGIQSVIPTLFQDGKFAGKDAYSAYLAQQNSTIDEFEHSLKRQMLASRIREVALEGIVVSPPELEAEYRRRSEKVKIAYVKISADNVKSSIQPTAGELKTYYDGHKAMYQSPERLSLGILVADQKKLAESVTVTDAELQRAYDTNRDKFRTPERVKVRHLLLKTVGQSKEDEAKTHAKAADLLKQIRGGADFATLAKKNSEDPGSAVNGGELPDWVSRGQMVPEFEQASFTLRPKEIGDLVKTQYGYHIVQVLEKESARLKGFDEVKATLADEYRKQKVMMGMQQLVDQAAAALRKDPSHPDKVAGDFKLVYIKADKVAASDPLPEIGINQDFAATLAGMKKGDVTQPVQIAGERVVMASVTGIFPAHPSDFEEVQAAVRDEVIKDRAAKLAIGKAEELASRVKGGEDLAKAAKALGFEVKTSDEFNRAGAVEGAGQASYFSEAFSKPVGSVIGPVGMPDNSRVVAKILSRTEANMADMAAQRDTMKEEIKGKKARERNALFEDGVREKLIREGKIKINQDAIKRLSSNYRG